MNCPNLTIRERLQVLRPGNPNDYYTKFEIVSGKYRELFQQGKVLVTNWHCFALESPHAEDGKSYVVVNKGPESDEAFARRVLGELYHSAPLLVFNDEGHHAYRPAQDDDSEENREATVWVSGLDRIHHACGIKLCVDLSATPFYIKGSGYPEGEPFPWIVSEFGLVDAIESGIAKIPRLPVRDDTGRPDPKYFKLWEHITQDLSPLQRIGRKPKPEVVWMKAEDALQTLAGQYKQRFEDITGANDLADKTPPVLIVVCDNTDIGEHFFRNISGEEEVEAVDMLPASEDANGEEESETTEESEPAKKPAKKRTVYTGGKVFPEIFGNAPGQKRTLRIDTKLLEKVESEDPGTTREKAALELRAVVNSVGKAGHPGAQVRCVVSVQMLRKAGMPIT